jgi:hypothetical protein
VSFETSFDSKQPKLGPKLVLALSKTKRMFRSFWFYGVKNGGNVHFIDKRIILLYSRVLQPTDEQDFLSY